MIYSATGTNSKVKEKQKELWQLHEIMVSKSAWKHSRLTQNGGYLDGLRQVEIEGMP